jgi:hypothetical protein
MNGAGRAGADVTKGGTRGRPFHYADPVARSCGWTSTCFLPGNGLKASRPGRRLGGCRFEGEEKQ